MKFTLLFFASALSINAYLLPGPAVAPLRTNVLVMSEADVMKPPKKDFMLTLAGGTRTIEDVYAAQKKAAKAYNSLKADGECDIKSYQKGWTTN
mmetsp:Transcript_39784/g.65955  ORF Transcript_39784/g.65955 Transcript_39784/m.65955 type:complete len:94 (+) Transcript_39784:66-347(+)